MNQTNNKTRGGKPTPGFQNGEDKLGVRELKLNKMGAGEETRNGNKNFIGTYKIGIFFFFVENLVVLV